MQHHARRPCGSATIGLVVALALGLAGARLQAQDGEAQPRPFEWQLGPLEAALGRQAEIDVPEGYVFLGGSETRRLLELMQNPTSGLELGTLSPADDEENWFLFFEYIDSGHVADDRDDLDPDDLLDSLRDGTEAGNESRRARGWPTLTILGWRSPPRYNPSTNNLEWAVDLRSDEDASPGVNFDVRLLGREGYMQVSLVCSPEEYARVMPQVEALLGGFSFSDGHRYDEFSSGDKVAEYGLAALVTGTGAAVALKTGLLQKFWKAIVAALVGLVALGKKILRAVTGRRQGDADVAEEP